VTATLRPHPFDDPMNGHDWSWRGADQRPLHRADCPCWREPAPAARTLLDRRRPWSLWDRMLGRG